MSKLEKLTFNDIVQICNTYAILHGKGNWCLTNLDGGTKIVARNRKGFDHAFAQLSDKTVDRVNDYFGVKDEVQEILLSSF